MKKTYINPEMNVVKILTQHQMLAGSTMGINGDYNGDVTIGSREFELEEEELEDDFEMEDEEL